MSLKKPIVALIYDFDGTLSPANMQEYGLIQALGNTVEGFWSASNGLGIDKSMCSVLAYMKVMIDEAARMNIPLTRPFLEQFGPQIELFNGVSEWFSLINSYGFSKGVKVEHYVISSGLTELIESTSIAGQFKKVFACSFLYDADGIARWPAVAVDYTAKTQFLFKISKGIMDISDNKLVNDSRRDEDKRIPFTNMIYFGDGDTDVPCMKIVKMFDGNSIAIYQKDNKKKVATARKLLNQGRVNFICDADYSPQGEIFATVSSIIDKIKAESNYHLMQKKTRQ
ncbi:MAG: haloacid dehalogenase-like hydrolase [Bacteroidales bacterium]|nr:haloacid dehalogenase-like hydrolase [Bacteroidales bacterium]